MLKRVLVPLDGSSLAELAIEPALHLVQQTDGTVYLMRVPVYTDSGAQTNAEYHRDWAADNAMPEYEDAAAYLRDTRNNVLRPGVTVKTTVGEGDHVDAIINTAVTKDVDLIAMATHARTGLTRWLLGSVAGKVIRRAQSPVLLIRQPSDYNHILVTLDGSELAEQVIGSAMALATGFGSRITLLQVDDQSEADLNKGAAAAENDNRPISNEEPYLDRLISQYAQSGVEMDALTVNGPVANNILSYADQNDVDLIAMSTRGRSGLPKLVFGSVTEKVMCDAGCAMLIVRLPDQEIS